MKLRWLVPVTIAIAAGSAHAASATLHWTAPGNDGVTGRAAAYDLRCAPYPIGAANFSSASVVPTGPPRAPGSPESVTVSGLGSGQIYYFAIRTVDWSQNWSAISNVPYVIVVDATDAGGARGFRLTPPRPNPARESAKWSYALPQPGRVELAVFDLAGRQVRAMAQPAAAAGEIVWNLRDDQHRRVAPGVYLVRARLGGETRVQRIAVTR